MDARLLASTSMQAIFVASAPAASTTFGYSGAIVDFTAPSTGLYDILAIGAEGGSHTAGTKGTGGLGEEVGGDFTLTAGETLEIIVGGVGISSPDAGGGGGGSFVVGPGDVPLVVAGGGGGAGYGPGGGNALPGTARGAGLPGGAGGTDGAGGEAGRAGGGGGFTGDGGTFTFGGGGGIGYNGGGGGGGYSGGGGGQGLSGGAGGGGGSFDGGTNPFFSPATDGGAGSVVITPLLPCFVAGTAILTDAGEVAVEALRPGDRSAP